MPVTCLYFAEQGSDAGTNGAHVDTVLALAAIDIAAASSGLFCRHHRGRKAVCAARYLRVWLGNPGFLTGKEAIIQVGDPEFAAAACRPEAAGVAGSLQTGTEGAR